MEQLPNGFTLDIPAGCFPLSTDSMALAWFAGHQKEVLDLGSGCGTLGLLLCSQNSTCTVTGIEQDLIAHEAALRNIDSNHLGGRMRSIQGDLRNIDTFLKHGTLPCCISNPPYFSGGAESRSFPDARKEKLCTLQDLMNAAAWALKFGGDFFLVHKPERLGEIIAAGAAKGLEAKRLGLVRHREGGNISLILVQLRKGAKPGLRLEEFALYDASGAPTDIYRKIYHIRED